MDSKITELYILIGFFCVLLIGKDSASQISAILNICYVLVILLVHLFKHIVKINKYVIYVFEIILTITFMYFGDSAIELFIPVIIYEIFESSFLNFVSIAGIIMADFLLFDKPIVYFIIYTVLLNLYMYEACRQNEDKIELKAMNKIEAANRNMLEEKLANMYVYMEQKDIAAALKERNYMAQKVHDHLGHRITSAIMQLEVTKATIGNDDETSKKYLLSAMDSLRQGMEEIREFLKHSKPGEKAVSIEEIKKQLLGFQYSTNIKTHFEVNGDINRFKVSVFNAIVENLREALTNAAKYSGAANVYFSINIYNKFARVEIRDDGKGTDKINKSLGLSGMEERIEALGGRIQFYNDEGFVINMIINI